MQEGLFVLMAVAGHTRAMYPIQIAPVVRRATLGSRADDPTLPDRPSRLGRLRTRFRFPAGGRPDVHGTNLTMTDRRDGQLACDGRAPRRSTGRRWPFVDAW
jgi:hypothetical protein